MILVLYDNHTKFGKRMPESYEKLLLPYDNPTIRPPSACSSSAFFLYKLLRPWSKQIIPYLIMTKS